MVSNYSKFQQLQLARQSYRDTQSTYLLLYAPGRCQQLAHTLERQHHRKFRLVNQLASPLSPAVDGVVLVAEDVELLSTALTCCAGALQDGADYADCDAVFGFDGSTVLYRPAGSSARSRFAVVSRALLERCRVAAHRPDDAAELIALAAKMAKMPQHLPLALLHYRRNVCAEDLFSDNGKRAFVFSHELNMTGAPIVLVSAIPVLIEQGFEVVVLGPNDGGSLNLFVNAGATVLTNPDCVSSPQLWGLAAYCDFVLANTVVEVNVIRALNGTNTPVLWWLHDAFVGYPYIARRIPHELERNIRVCAVGSHATAAMHSVRPGFAIRQLVYGLPDYSKDAFETYDISYAGGRPLFVSVGAFEKRKGQDILVEAIRMLPEDVRTRAAFLFVGKGADPELMEQVRALTEDMPQEVFYVKRLSRGEIKSLMAQCACTVCSSRDDPMPTFVTEGLIFGKPGIVSEHTGTAGLITEGVDGYIYRDDDPAELAAALQNAILHPETLRDMHTACRALYEKYYSEQAFATTLASYVQELYEEYRM